MYGYDRAALVEMRNTDLSAEPGETRRLTPEPPAGGGSLVNVPVRLHRRRDGTVFPVEIIGRYFTQGGRRVLTVAIRDISDRLHAAEDLQRANDRLSLAARAGGVGMWDLDVATDRLSWDDQMLRLYGITREEFTDANEAWQSGVHPDDRQRADAEIHAALRGEKEFDTEFRVVWPDGTIRDIRALALVARDASGRPLRMVGTNWDITAQKRLERALASSEENFRTFFDTVDDIILVGSIDGRIVYANPALERKLGYDATDVAEMPMLGLHPPDRRREAEEIYAAMWRRERNACPLPLQGKKGALLPVETRVWFGQWNGVDCVFGICKDLSAEQEALQKFDRLFRHNPSPMAVSGLFDRRFSDVNDAWLATLGYTREEVIGRTSQDLGLFADLEAAQAVADELVETGHVGSAEIQTTRRDGTILDGIFSGEIIESQGRQYFLTVMVDISERRRAEEALLLQAQKMDTVGQLAGGIAHDFNNLLAVIAGNAELVGDGLGADDPRSVAIAEIEDAARRGSALTRQLLAVSRRQAIAPEVLELNEVVAEIQGMLRHVIGAEISLRFEPGEPIGHVLADRSRLGQVLLNLVVNGRDAMPAGGTLTIATRDVVLGEADAGRPASLAPGRYVALSVTDTGAGMDAATRARIFEPFFTTKAPGSGTGLGLPTVLRIAQQSGGSVGVESEPGRGSIFTLYLPAIDEKVPAGAATAG